jgi:hypothetical protein
VTYGKHVLSVQQVSDQYNDKYKGIWVCLQVGTSVLSMSRLGSGSVGSSTMGISTVGSSTVRYSVVGYSTLRMSTGG